MKLENVEEIFPFILMILYIMLGALGLASLSIELIYHRAKWNSLKLFFYMTFFLHNLTRAIALGWDTDQSNYYDFSSDENTNKNNTTSSIGADSDEHVVPGIQFYSNFPALIFISYAGLIALQMIQFSTPESIKLSDQGGRFRENNWFWVKWGSNILIAINLMMYFVSFLLFGLAERGGGQTTYSILEYFFLANLLILLLGHCLTYYKTFWRFKNIFGIKLNLLHLSLIILIGCRCILLLLNPASIMISMELLSNKELILSFIYFIVGEILPAFVILFIEYLLPYHDESYTPLGTFEENWKIKEIQKRERINNGGSGAIVYQCRVLLGNGRTENLAGKIINKKNGGVVDLSKLRNEIKIYQQIDCKHILKYYNYEETADELILLLEYMPNTLHRYILARKVCENKFGLVSFLTNTTYYANQSVKPPGIPYYFTYKEITHLLYQIAIGMDYLHKSDIIHKDIKPGNIFLTLSSTNQIVECKLGDFDISIMLAHNPADIINPIDNCSDYSSQFALDILYFGLLIYDLLVLNDNPWNADSNRLFVAPPLPISTNVQLQQQLNNEHGEGYKLLYQLYNDCVVQDYKQRPSSDDILIRIDALTRY